MVIPRKNPYRKLKNCTVYSRYDLESYIWVWKEPQGYEKKCVKNYPANGSVCLHYSSQYKRKDLKLWSDLL